MELTNTVFGGDFRVERPLAEGGMGGVYVAQQLSTGLSRALKVMHPALVTDPAMRERFAQEARIGGRVASEHVVQVIAAGIDPNLGVPWIAMELLDGEDLGALSARRGPLPLSEVVPIFRQLCHALGAAHAASIVHRDVKPENVFLANVKSSSSTWVVKVLDFGIAKLAADAQQSSTRGIGTPLWMAPEQTESQAPSAAADVWSLGLLAFFLLTGHYYWRAASGGGLSALMREILVDPLTPASGRAAEVGAVLPAGFDVWFSRCVAREPHLRYGDAHSAFSALEMLAAGTLPSTVSAASVSPVAGSVVTPAPRQKSRAALFIGLGLAAVVFGGGALVLGTVAFFYQDEIGQLGGSTAARPGADAPAASAGPIVATNGESTETTEATEPTKAPAATTTKQAPTSVNSDKAPTPVATAAADTPSPQANADEKKTAGLRPIDRSAVQAKIDALAAGSTTACAKDKTADASVETYSGSCGYRPDGSTTKFFQGAGGARDCVRARVCAVTVGKYDHPQEWHVEVFKWSVSVK
jgi:hypothetical protein